TTALSTLSLHDALPISRLFISGIVKVPVPTTFAVELPEMLPINPLETTETCAGPPRRCPMRPTARSMKNCPSPLAFRNEANRMRSEEHTSELQSRENLV